MSYRRVRAHARRHRDGRAAIPLNCMSHAPGGAAREGPMPIQDFPCRHPPAFGRDSRIFARLDQSPARVLHPPDCRRGGRAGLGQHSPTSYHAFVHARWFGGLTLDFLVNEMFMAFFFGIAAVEITDSLLPGGSLNPPRKAVTPLLGDGRRRGRAGRRLLPAQRAYSAAPSRFAAGESRRPRTSRWPGWWRASRSGEHHPAVSFLLLLAIADDAIGLAIIAIFYPDPTHPVSPLAALLVLAGMLVALGLRRGGVRSYWPYLLLGGTPSWLGLYWRTCTRPWRWSSSSRSCRTIVCRAADCFRRGGG